jgi:inorganic phosphate transporter, PiT family
MPTELDIVIALGLLFNFLNRVHDSSNIVATMISPRAFRPRTAMAMTALAESLGPFLFGVAVATTIGDDIAVSGVITMHAITACLISEILWDLFTWFLGYPSSSSHALIGGLIGAVAIGVGFGALKLSGLGKVLFALFTSPLIGFVVGFVLLRFIFFLARGATPGINQFFKHAQFITVIGMAFSHGTNDAQKTMGVLTLGLVIGGVLPTFKVPLWGIAASAAAIALGTATGGWRLIRTLGGKFYKIRPVHSLATQLTSSIIILVASLLAGPSVPRRWSVLLSSPSARRTAWARCAGVWRGTLSRHGSLLFRRWRFCQREFTLC